MNDACSLLQKSDGNKTVLPSNAAGFVSMYIDYKSIAALHFFRLQLDITLTKRLTSSLDVDARLHRRHVVLVIYKRGCVTPHHVTRK
jgi:hypothetical protein